MGGIVIKAMEISFVIFLTIHSIYYTQNLYSPQTSRANNDVCMGHVDGSLHICIYSFSSALALLYH